MLSQRWPRNASYIWVTWKFSGLPDYAHGQYSQHFHGLLLRSTLWMFLQNLKSVALPVPEIRGVAKLQTPNFEEREDIGGQGWYHSKERWWVPISPPYILFLYQQLFAQNFRLYFWVGVSNPQFGEGEAVSGQGWYHSKERWWVSIGRP